MNKQVYDIIIIGAGSGGLNVAGFFSRLKLKVLLIDKTDASIGGDCLNTGCVPSKVLIHIAKLLHSVKQSEHFLIDKIPHTLDIKRVTDWVKAKQDVIRKNENKESLRERGIDFVSGTASFIDEKTVSVNDEPYTASQFVLATGSRPRKLSISNDGSIKEFTNENIFTIDFLPKEFVFIGGGPICAELAQAFSRLGSKVTIVNGGKRLLEKEAFEVSALLEKMFQDEGIEVIHDVTLQKIENGKVFCIKNKKAEEFVLSADALFVGIGRALNIDNLDLEKASVRTDESKTKLIVDEYLKTTNKRISVVGDVAGNFQFTHAAEVHAKLTIQNMLSPFKKKFETKNFAWVTYTSPEIATFGVSKQIADERKYDILYKDVAHEDRAIVDDVQSGFSMLYLDKKGKIMGGTVMCEGAGEIAQEFILAMTEEMTLGALFRKVYPYPTASRINRALAGEYLAKRLTERNSALLRTLYRCFSGW